MASLGDLMVVLGLDTSNYTKGMQKAEQQVNSFGKTTQTGMNQAGTSFQKAETQATTFANNVKAGLDQVKTAVLSTVAAIGAGFGLFEMAKSAATYGDTIYDLSKQMGITGSEAAYMSAMFEQAGTDSSSFVSAISRLDKGLLTAGAHGNTTTRTLQAFDVQLMNSKGLKNMPDQLKALADGYDRATAAGQETAYVTTVLGARGQDLVPLLADYSEYADIVGKIDFSGIDVDALHQESQSMKEVALETKLVGVAFGSALLPIVQTLAPMLLKALQDIAKVVNVLRPYITALVVAITGFSVILLATTWIRWLYTGLQSLKIAELAASAITYCRNAIVAFTVALEADPITAIASLVMWILVAIAAVTGLDYWLKKLAADSGSTVADTMTSQMSDYNSQLDDALTTLNKMGASFDELYSIGQDTALPDFSGTGTGTGGGSGGPGGAGAGAKTKPPVIGAGEGPPWQKKPPAGMPPIVVPPPPEGAWDSFWEGIKKKYEEIKNKLGQPFPPLPVPDLGTAFAEAWERIVADAKAAAQRIADAFRGLNPFPTLEALGAAAWAAIKKDAQDAGNAIENDLKGLNPFPTLEALGAAAWAKLKTDAQQTGKDIENDFKGLNPFPTLATAGAVAWAAIKTGAQTAWSDIKAGAQNATTGMEDVWQKHKTTVLVIIGALVVGIIVALLTILTGGLDLVVAGFAAGWAGIAAGATGAASTLGLVIGGALAALLVVAARFKDQIIGFFQEIPAKAEQVWQDISTSFTNWIGQLPQEASNVVSSVENFFSGISAGADQEFQGIATAFSNWVGQLPAVASRVVQSIIGVFQSLVSDVSGIFNSITSDANNVMSVIRGALGMGGGSAMPAGNTTEGALLQSMGAVPAYADGGYVDRPTLAMVGEGGTGEFITPVPQMAALLAAVAGSGGGGYSGPTADDIAQAVASALSGLKATIDTSRQNLLGLSRVMAPINQAETIRRG
jgi:hypothetical protein